jgi:hypothetical protein
MITVALALAFAGIGRPPINPPGIDCPKGTIFKRGQCWRRIDDSGMGPDGFIDPQADQAEEDFHRWIDGEIERGGKRRR